MIWRDDDISVRTTVAQLQAVDDVFQQFGAVHTVAIIAEHFERATALIDFIKARHIVPQLHCWTHEDLTADILALRDLHKGAALLTTLFGAPPTMLYPPWNRSNWHVRDTAAQLGLRVSNTKVSLDQYVRFEGHVGETTINFHYWHQEDTALLPAALRYWRLGDPAMKITDYCPRAAPFDTYLTGRGLVGAEVGVDVGAHAEALLRYCDIQQLTLIDPWPREYAYGYLIGRLSALGFWPKVRLVKLDSHTAARNQAPESLDFLYIDQLHDYDSVSEDLRRWWPAVKRGGVLGYRNYSASANPELRDAVDKFIAENKLTAKVETGEVILFK